jgi:hypothetical protein
VKLLASTFFDLILARQLWMRHKVVSEGKMPRDLRRPLLIAVKLHPSAASKRVFQDTITAAWKAVLAPPRVPEFLDGRTRILELCVARDNGHQIKNWLCANAGNGGRTDMMHDYNHLADSGRKPVRFPSRIVCPRRIMLT